jgi:hypothetical protein
MVEEFITEFTDAAWHQDHEFSEVEPTHDTPLVETPPVSHMCRQGHLTPLAHFGVTTFRFPNDRLGSLHSFTSQGN